MNTSSLLKIIPRCALRPAALPVVLLAALLALACSGDGVDPLLLDNPELTGGGKLSMGGHGPNRIITWSNADTASQELDEALVQAYYKASQSIKRHSDLRGQVRIIGDYYGYAIASVELSPDFIITPDSVIVPDTATATYDLSLVFSDYSDQGKLFMGGSLRLRGRRSSFGLLRDFQVWDALYFSGSWQGMARYDGFLLPFDPSGQLYSVFITDLLTVLKLQRRGSITYHSGGNSLNINPYPSATALTSTPID